MPNSRIGRYVEYAGFLTDEIPILVASWREAVSVVEIESLKDLRREIEKLHYDRSYICRKDDVLELINSFEAGLRKRLEEYEKEPRPDYHCIESEAAEWWSCPFCGKTGGEDEMCGHVVCCKRDKFGGRIDELRMVLGGEGGGR